MRFRVEWRGGSFRGSHVGSLRLQRLGLCLFGRWLGYVLLGQFTRIVSRYKFADGDLLVLHLHLVNGAQFPHLEKLDDFSGGKGSDLFPALGNGMFFFEAQGFSVGTEKREAKGTLTSSCRKGK